MYKKYGNSSNRKVYSRSRSISRNREKEKGKERSISRERRRYKSRSCSSSTITVEYERDYSKKNKYIRDKKNKRSKSKSYFSNSSKTLYVNKDKKSKIIYMKADNIEEEYKISISDIKEMINKALVNTGYFDINPIQKITKSDNNRYYLIEIDGKVDYLKLLFFKDNKSLKFFNKRISFHFDITNQDINNSITNNNLNSVNINTLTTSNTIVNNKNISDEEINKELEGSIKLLISNIPYYYIESDFVFLFERLKIFSLKYNKEIITKKYHINIIEDIFSKTSKKYCILEIMNINPRCLNISSNNILDTENTIINESLQNIHNIFINNLVKYIEKINTSEGNFNVKFTIDDEINSLIYKIKSLTTISDISHSRVLCIKNMITKDEIDDLRDDSVYKRIFSRVISELRKYGKIINLKIPRPNEFTHNIPGYGKVFVEYTTIEGSIFAKETLNELNSSLIIFFYSEDKFRQGCLE